MHIISRKILVEFWTQPKYRETEEPLKAWFSEVDHATWHTSEEVRQQFPSADPVGDNRIVFNILWNRYRLVVKIHYNTGIVYIRFVGTHKQYNQIDVEKI